MMMGAKIKALLKLRSLSSVQLRTATGLSRATLSRIMHGHTPAPATLARIAAVLEVSLGYLKGGYTMPEHLREDDILFLADMRNVPLLRLVREAAEKGINADDFRKLIDIAVEYR
ncbi:MAG: helix-turn-helix domain-containing protein [Desulfocucumaceae bacterium]